MRKPTLGYTVWRGSGIYCVCVRNRNEQEYRTTVRRNYDIRGHHGLALSPFLVQYYGRKDASSSINSPVPTLTGAPRHALVNPPPVQSSFIVEYYSKGRIRNLCEPLGGLTTKERFGLVINSGSADQTPSIDRWGYRMLSVPETAGAMGFPCTRLGASKDYAIVGSNAMKHRLVGQAVCPPVMRAIVERLVDLLSSQR